MQKQKQFDIVNEILEQCILAFPVSSFIISLYKQYQRLGSLSKKQLTGLHGVASKTQTISVGKLATLEALINKMPTRYKSALPEVKPLIEKDTEAIGLIDEILSKYPQHKRVLFLKAKYENNESIGISEVAELKKFKSFLK